MNEPKIVKDKENSFDDETKEIHLTHPEKKDSNYLHEYCHFLIDKKGWKLPILIEDIICSAYAIVKHNWKTFGEGESENLANFVIMVGMLVIIILTIVFFLGGL